METDSDPTRRRLALGLVLSDLRLFRNRTVVWCLLFTGMIVAMLCPHHAVATVLYDWNEPGASGTNWPGWTWYPNGADDYGSPGWRKNDGRWYSGNSNWYPRIHLKHDYGNADLATIVNNDRAPSTAIGGALKIYDTGASGTYQACWWFLWGDTLQTKGLADTTTNRVDFYLKATGLGDQYLTSDPENATIHIGTYLCWPNGGYGGESCPTEADGQHYYHYLTINPNAWLHVQLDQHPTWQRGTGIPNNNPAGSSHPYFAYMNGFYTEIRSPQSQATALYLDEMKTWQQTQSENESSITSLWVGYWPATGKWEVGFNDLSWGNSYGNYNDATQSKFEIRWSTSLITNSNWSSANTIIPEFHRYGSTNSFRRPNSWKSVAWTRFTLPAGIEANNDIIYFAVKDTSSLADGDGHNAATSLIRTIDYNLRPDSSPPPPTDSTPPSPPGKLRIR